MKGFKNFIMEQEQLKEAMIKKGAVAAYALQGRKHGNNSVRSYNKAKQTLRAVKDVNSTNQKVDVFSKALNGLLDGLISQRKQIGSVSAQVTTLTVL